jgi:glycosyltransferase involved in cell wall biosynthesis
MMDATPSVNAIVPTRNRPELLARAVRAILSQEYAGDLEVTIVVDQSDPQQATVGLPDDPRICVISNDRKPGLSGTRNTGILRSAADLIAFCDDDDEWLPGKLAAQAHALQRMPEAEFASCAIEVDFEGSRSVRLAGKSVITHDDLLPSRMSMLHSSTFVARRAAMVDGIGLVDEEAPASQNEDWDLLLRASARAPIAHVDEPLVRIYWSGSYFSRDWETKVSSLEWMLAKHPDITTSAKGAARVYGQIAFGYAAWGHRRAALQWAGRSVRRRASEPRAYLALATAAGVSGEWILRTLHKRGRGV